MAQFRIPPAAIIGASPAAGLTSANAMRSVVVLPAPFGPRKPVIRPVGTSKYRSSTALTEPKCLVRPRTETSVMVLSSI
jgi:hypothetical protein